MSIHWFISGIAEIEVDVRWRYSKPRAATLTEPAEDAEVEILGVWVASSIRDSDNDLLPFLNEETVEKLELEAAERYCEERENEP